MTRTPWPTAASSWSTGPTRWSSPAWFTPGAGAATTSRTCRPRSWGSPRERSSRMSSEPPLPSSETPSVPVPEAPTAAPASPTPLVAAIDREATAALEAQMLYTERDLISRLSPSFQGMSDGPAFWTTLPLMPSTPSNSKRSFPDGPVASSGRPSPGPMSIGSLERELREMQAARQRARENREEWAWRMYGGLGPPPRQLNRSPERDVALGYGFTTETVNR